MKKQMHVKAQHGSRPFVPFPRLFSFLVRLDNIIVSLGEEITQYTCPTFIYTNDGLVCLC